MMFFFIYDYFLIITLLNFFRPQSTCKVKFGWLTHAEENRIEGQNLILEI